MLTAHDAPASSQIRSLDALLLRLQQGDRVAHNELVRFTQHRLRLHVHKLRQRFRIPPHQDDTSDILQNVWVRLQRTLQNLKVASGLDFLRLSSMHIRQELVDLTRSPSARQPLSALLRDPADRTSSPEQLAQWREIHEHLAQLPGQERDLFDLLYYQGVTREQAAQLLGLSLSTLKRHWIIAREKFHQWLNSESIWEKK